MAGMAVKLVNTSVAMMVKVTEEPDPHGGGGGEHEHHHPQEVVYFCFVALLLGAVTMHFLSRCWPSLPYTVGLLVEGLLLGLLHAATEEAETLGAFNRSMEMWSNINPEVLLYVFLPALLFGECMTLRWHVVRKTILQCLTLAGPGVLVGTFLTAGVAMFIFPANMYPWTTFQSLTFGAILAATDPVAVVAILKELGASPKLTMIISGEALLNDGTAIVVTYLFKAMAMVEAGHKDALIEIGAWNEDAHPLPLFILVFFIRMAICAAVFGVFTGLVCAFLCSWAGDKTSHNDTTIQIAVCLSTAYLTFFIGDHIAGVSGVLATVVSGVTVSALCWPMFNDPGTMTHVWHMFEYIGNTLIFVLAGLVIGSNVASHLNYLGWMDVVWLLVLYVLMNVIRGFMVLLFYPALRVMGYGLSWREAIVLSYGGLRGAVGLSLALIISLENWNGKGGAAFPTQVVFFVGGIATLTMLVNGTTAAVLLRKLGMTKTDRGKEQIFAEVKRRVRKECEGVLATEKQRLVNFSEDQVQQVIGRCACLREGGGHGHGAQTATTQLTPSTWGFKKRVAVREFFLTAVKTAYSELIAKGILRQDGPQEMILRSSIEHALDHIDSPDGLKDFEYIHQSLEKPKTCVASVWRKTLSCLTAALSLHDHQGVVAVHERTCIYLLMCFIQAHKDAQYTMTEFLEDNGDIANERDEVIDHSKAEVEKATAELAERSRANPGLIEFVTIQQVAIAVLEAERRYVDTLIDGGIVDDGQAHTLYHEIQHDMVNLRKAEGALMAARRSQAQDISLPPRGD